MAKQKLLMPFERQTLSDVLDGVSSTVLIAISDISSVVEFCPVSAKVPDGLSLIKLKKGDTFPVKGTPAHIFACIEEAAQ